MLFLAVALLYCGLGLSQSIKDADGLEYNSESSRKAHLPLLKLPYGTWQASQYDAKTDIYWFRNIRFAAPPVESLRWAKPAPPATNTTLQTGAYGATCPQANPGGIQIPIFYPENEDCLFLDVVIPGKALKRKAKLPVVNWIYGGAFVGGSKDGPTADGGPIVAESSGNLIWVAGNYRLGGLGFLAGPTVEKEATPNAGLYDQIAVFDWIQSYIHLVGGDPGKVSVWGQSAGAGSILHHLVAFGGKNGKAKFRKAVIASPANNPQLDRSANGTLEKQYQTTLSRAGCAGKGLPCLKKVPWQTIKNITAQFLDEALPGQFGFGPAVDGIISRQLPDLELASGNIVRGIDSFVITHVGNEAFVFVPETVKNNHTFFEQEIIQTFGPDPSIRREILKQYPPPGPGRKFADEQQRFIAYMQAQFFVCHVRFIAQAYDNDSGIYAGEYYHGTGFHSSDLPAIFYNASAPPVSPAPGVPPDLTLGTFAPIYQDYLISHAISKNPNTYHKPGVNASVNWPMVDVDNVFHPVLLAGNTTFTTIKDYQTSAEQCDIWLNVWAKATQDLGLVPPGGGIIGKW
ncbi:alpha/beta-hydrolase [Microthyrium microscopicum]|uniref:Alpha/beta-hydrolase n=1 Tax=Microthyrium microscopicum TaxID=703497 RepID=A0A6A6U4R0_9PEZI|nr:alpha/beta-hydrolase [Microthyrium microscopicum]